MSWLRCLIAGLGIELFARMFAAPRNMATTKTSYPQSYPHQHAAGVTVTMTNRRQQEPRNRHQARQAKRRAALQAMR